MIYFKYYFPLLPVFLETHKTPLCYHSGAYISIYPRTGRLERPVPFWGLCAAVRREHPHTRSLQPALQPVFRLGVGLHITLCLQPLSPPGQTAAFCWPLYPKRTKVYTVKHASRRIPLHRTRLFNLSHANPTQGQARENLSACLCLRWVRGRMQSAASHFPAVPRLFSANAARTRPGSVHRRRCCNPDGQAVGQSLPKEKVCRLQLPARKQSVLSTTGTLRSIDCW